MAGNLLKAPHIYIRVIQSIRWILPKELTIESINYCATFFKEIFFFKEIDSDGFFYVPEDY